MNIKYYLILLCIIPVITFSMNPNIFLLQSNDKNTLTLTLPHSVVSTLSKNKTLQSVLSKYSVNCEYIADSAGLQLMSDFLRALANNEGYSQIKELARAEGLEKIKGIIDQLKSWGISKDSFLDNQNSTQLLTQANQQTIDKPVSNCSFSKDGSILALGTTNGEAWYYTIQTQDWKLIGFDVKELECQSISLSSDKQVFVATFPDKWKLFQRSFDINNDWNLDKQEKNTTSSVIISENGTLAMMGEDSGITVVQANRNPVERLYSNNTVTSPRMFSDSGEFIYAPSISNPNIVFILNSADGSLYAQASGGNISSISTINSTHDQRYIVSGDKAGGLAVYDFKGTLIVSDPKAHSGQVNAISCAHVQNYLFATGGNDGLIKLWSFSPDNKILKLVNTIAVGVYEITQLKFSDDDALLFCQDSALGTFGNTYVYNQQGSIGKIWSGTTKFALSENNSRLALVYPDKTIIMDINLNIYKNLNASLLLFSLVENNKEMDY